MQYIKPVLKDLMVIFHEEKGITN